MCLSLDWPTIAGILGAAQRRLAREGLTSGDLREAARCPNSCGIIRRSYALMMVSFAIRTNVIVGHVDGTS
jgi:hypothetical protein